MSLLIRMSNEHVKLWSRGCVVKCMFRFYNKNIRRWV